MKNNITNDMKLFEILNNCLKESDIFTLDHAPVYTLKECLECTDESNLKTMYLTYALMRNSKIKKEEKLSREKAIEFFVKQIPEEFKNYMNTFTAEELKILKDCQETKETKTVNIDFIFNGFMYAFKNGKDNTYVIPKELLEIFEKEYSEEEALKLRKQNIRNYIIGYTLTVGVFPKKIICELIKENFGLSDLTEDEIDKIVEKENITIFNNEYYSIYSDDEDTQEFLDNREDFDIDDMEYVNLCYLELCLYVEYLFGFCKKIEKIVKLEEPLEIVSVLVEEHLSSDEQVEKVKEIYNLNKKESEKLEQLLREEHNNLRFWDFLGHTCSERFEDDEDYDINYYQLKEIPKKKDLLSCLKNLNEDDLEVLLDEYDVEDDSLETLREKIIKSVQYDCDMYDYVELKKMLFLNATGEYDDFDYEFDNGYIFVVEEDDDLKIVIPDEIVEIFRNQIPNTKDTMPDYDLIIEYMHQNGVLEKEELQRLLKEFENVDFTIEQLDDYLKDDCYIIENKYYSIINYDDSDDYLVLIKTKKMYPYKILDLTASEKEEEFVEKLNEFINNEIGCETENSNDLNELIIQVTKMGCYDAEIINDAIREFNIKLKANQKNKLFDIIKKYKNDIPIWVYNGYTLNDIQQERFLTKEKVGRNEPCPCGSGKKYKKCCGR